MRTRKGAIFAVGVGCCMLLAGSLWFAERFAPSRYATTLVRPGMTKHQVVESLGVLYDNAQRREFSQADAVISKMNNPDTISFVCHWRIAYSRDRFWVGFDEDDNVVATLLESEIHSLNQPNGTPPMQ
jgi:hypothetical protein